MLTELEEALGARIDDLAKRPDYVEFVKSDAYEAWMKKRKGK